MNEKMFELKMGYPPIQDDLERVNCEHAGELGHSSCGWCDTCDSAKFSCTCPAAGKLVFIEGTLSPELSDMKFFNSLQKETA